ncbi:MULTISPECIES: NAD(P)(+) transhydrogenase (Re/Si-specific) subunit beta [Marinobacter]|jgi:NAD(P) transhydrogenase subunit beta|uniref:NAD(P) transhydrogenase subunit beta n=2 Tax=Marinobacter nauticus TaxID=2743 RepID=A0A833NFJ2_MARNT|nr:MULTISPECIES: NAD(P)(+) transhydrogenase (Re/Si-specific) subunit beta [Marinobacter]MAP32356.1 NAD synthetase [Marinobacter sp.]MCG8521430.1 NAD(P)(+) transhydrogenase (Re/Si-specific) subunit beta [Pseudomonadales bacterium]MEC8823895.1 NAD(P)(+) transhydrogenase (Re/Si-specific) subunit beta [Pseudomonadota bacterium]KAE8547584.1 NAD(P) transhydrogenase subunit beta [Marinobacter nauticus]MBN8240879.1 NAD(P)(+) transhydrogenase (Re/Si-specific) subunit beta [Marinobacter nauticus]|tara:strand:+ start:1318 stop:2715 length:1398 start_codon:yes stop_codon:yes gene_type:complete
MFALINLSYLAAAVCFILGIKGMTRPKTAVRGNQLAAIGMLIAVVAALLHQEIISYAAIIAGMLLGGSIGVWLAKRTATTEMPELVASLNGIGGGASVAVAASTWMHAVNATGAGSSGWTAAILASIVIGSVTLTGSVVAVLKLKGNIGDSRNNRLWHSVTLVTLIAAVTGAVLFATSGSTSPLALAALVGLCLLLGIGLVQPIGGADMPVVVALLNAYSGLAGAATGFVLGNQGLIITGSLVGASGLILTAIMCKAMNRSLPNVLFGGVLGGSDSTASQQDEGEFYDGKVKYATPDDLALLLDGARKVVMVPGYGLAVAQAQHAVKELANQLEGRGAKVSYAIHPVAGRMPGHMNVLLAEAEIPYDQLKDMDAINPELPQADVAIVLGANDVVNPAAAEDPNSPIFGMPILDVHKAKTVVVVKRSLSAGFAGIPNGLFIRDNSLMVKGDAKEVLQATTSAIKEL